MSDTEITAGVALVVVLVSLAYAIGVIVGWAARGMPEDDETVHLPCVHCEREG